MLRTIIELVFGFMEEVAKFAYTLFLLAICVVGLLPIVFLFGGFEAVLVAIKDDKLPFE